MSTPKAFQRVTTAEVLKAFDQRKRVRRFLVADEVGLGKTVVARCVIEGLMKRKARSNSGPLSVFYVCSSLAIAAQNKGSLLKVLNDSETQKRASCDVDRLTLAPNRTLPHDVPLHLYTLTPDTSIPDRKGRHRSGSAEERALLHNLLVTRYPDLVKLPGKGEWLQRNATASWKSWKRSSRTSPTPSLASAFFPVLRRQLELEPGQHLPSALVRLVQQNTLDAIKQLRVALARTGLERLAPDLVIFDEFQRFQDLLANDDRGSDIAREMVRIGPGGAAVLLMSATPYRLYGGDIESAFTEAPHHEQFFNLVEWLLGGDAEAKQGRMALEVAFRQYGDALRSSDPVGTEAQAAKNEIETHLRPVIARTERFGYEAGRDMAEAVALPAPLRPEDLEAFRHVYRCFQEGDGEVGRSVVGAAVAYWSSVPLAMQTLGPDYIPWKNAKMLPLPHPNMGLSKQKVQRFRGPAFWSHPRLRGFSDRFGPRQLATPWLPPSLSWWPVAGSWRDNAPEKALLFSRFRAVPRAIAGLMSYDVERHLLLREGMRFDSVTRKTLLGQQRENLAFFHPSWALAQLIEPWSFRTNQRRPRWTDATDIVIRALAERGVRVVANNGRVRTLPELMILLERKLDTWQVSLTAWRAFAQSVARSDELGEMSLRARVDQWDTAVDGSLIELTRSEAELLGRAALASPGAVIARSAVRHGLSLSAVGGVQSALRASWEGLRSYLNNPWMNAAIVGTGDYRKRISRAIIDGNLEAVLDEHLWVTSTLRYLDPTKLFQELTTALSLRTSDVRFYGLRGGSFNLRAHAVLAFTQAVRRHRPDATADAEPVVRTDDLRIAFNSPFWPYVLASTSVGQEGLDFHAWCSTVAHWDLPGDPVDLEQREGRIDRYAGIATRRVLAAQYAPVTSEVATGRSPWDVLASRVNRAFRDDPIGLAPWWITKGARVRRIVFDVPLSEARTRFEELRQQRLLYRITLGQPDQSDLVHALKGRLQPDEVVAAAINLSPRREK